MAASTTPENTEPSSEEKLVEKRVDGLLAAHPPGSTPAVDFLGAQFDAGLAFVHFPVGYGGLELSRKLQPVVTRRLVKAGAPFVAPHNPIGYGMGAPTVVTLGSEEQKQRYLRPLFTGEEIWCQLFSEPGAGSDVASLSTRAVRDGDEWVINGQKVWTTLAHTARFGMLLARTDPDTEKHKGLTYFVVDMHAPGVEVRPLRQMTGDAEFNEVYFTDVRIPDGERLSEVGEGWRGAIVTLMNERASIGGAAPRRGAGRISVALELWRRLPEGDPVLRDRLVRSWIDAEVLRLTNMRAAANSAMGTPGPEGSIGKLAVATLNQRIAELCVDLSGAAGMLYDSYEMKRPDQPGALEGSPGRMLLRCQANSIEGGTSNVMRNILGERVLGLPGDVRVDKDKAWSAVPRS
jgi:alkylation response protein AidB-like acyl-CoA dehydrogenase